jgi:hypothetical protein
METPTESGRPAGSGRFAILVGVIYIVLGISVAIVHFTGITVPIAYILPGWFLCSGLIAIVWGRNRVKTGNRANGSIGMPTINMLVTMLGVAFAIAALSH